MQDRVRKLPPTTMRVVVILPLKNTTAYVGLVIRYGRSRKTPRRKFGNFPRFLTILRLHQNFLKKGNVHMRV